MFLKFITFEQLLLFAGYPLFGSRKILILMPTRNWVIGNRCPLAIYIQVAKIANLFFPENKSFFFRFGKKKGGVFLIFLHVNTQVDKVYCPVVKHVFPACLGDLLSKTSNYMTLAFSVEELCVFRFSIKKGHA